jgi:hypothetical protein
VFFFTSHVTIAYIVGTTNSVNISESLHLIPAPPYRFYQQNSDTFVNCPGLSWSERFMVRSFVFHCMYVIKTPHIQPSDMIRMHCQVKHDTDIRGGGNGSDKPETDAPRRKRKTKLDRKRKKSSFKKGKSHMSSTIGAWCRWRQWCRSPMDHHSHHWCVC